MRWSTEELWRSTVNPSPRVATLTVISIGLTLLVGLRSRLNKPAHDALMGLGWMVLVQYALGITTLVLVVPAWAGTMHQTCAAILLSVALVVLHRLRGVRAV